MSRARALRPLAFFDAVLPGSTWRPWRVFAAAVHGAPLEGEDLAMFRRCTGRAEPRPGGYAEAVAISGVQSGKTRVAATFADHAALTGEPGTHALLVGQDHRGAMRALLNYARAPFAEVPSFKREVAGERADTIELKRGTYLSAYPCRPAALRGLRGSVVCIDELAFFVATDGRPVDAEMLRVARGRVATTGGKVVVISSPYGASGALHELWRRHFGRDSDTLVWQAPAYVMNPTLAPDYLDRMRAEDPDAAQSEVEGDFRRGVSTLFDPDVLDAAVDHGTHERPRQDGRAYVAYCDVASGSGQDAFCVAVAHREGQAAVLDALWRWAPPFDPEAVTSEAAERLKRYGLATLLGDKYAAGFQTSAWERAGVAKRDCERGTSENYLELLVAANSGAALLLDEPTLLRELRTLERRTGTGGRDRVDHRHGAHDDSAAAAAGALVEALKRPALTGRWEFVWGAGARLRDATGVDSRGREWRNGEPWSGEFPVPGDVKGRTVRYRDGRPVTPDGQQWFRAWRVAAPGQPANRRRTPELVHRRQLDDERDLWEVAGEV